MNQWIGRPRNANAWQSQGKKSYKKVVVVVEEREREREDIETCDLPQFDACDIWTGTRGVGSFVGPTYFVALFWTGA